MIKHYIWLSLAIALTTAIYNPIKQTKIIKTENKSISFSIFKSISYTSEAYNHTSAQVQVVVEKIDAKGRHTKVWEKTYDPKNLSQYPNEGKALSRKIVVSNLKKGKEYLEVSYLLTYNTKGKELQLQGRDLVKDKNKQIAISI